MILSIIWSWLQSNCHVTLCCTSVKNLLEHVTTYKYFKSYRLVKLQSYRIGIEALINDNCFFSFFVSGSELDLKEWIGTLSYPAQQQPNRSDHSGLKSRAKSAVL